MAEQEEEKTEHVVSEQPDQLQGGPEAQQPDGTRLGMMSLVALGVVYGDIGTSPLYALHIAFFGKQAIQLSTENVLGVLSLVFWSLTIVITIKYVTYVMRAGNEGEGGILALMALLAPSGEPRRRRWFLVMIGVFGAALLYGDGMITPAISVMSAVGGLKVATKLFDPYIVFITVIILILLFTFERQGTAIVGSVFGPIMLLWFTTLAVLGIQGIIRHPSVLLAVDPLHGARFLMSNAWAGFVILGAVFLTVTGGEALYADMGHFGKRPIRLAWFSLVLPALLLNYFGQGALLIYDGNHITQPFYQLAPTWALYPLVLLATLATIIASQAIISGAFSLTRQGALLGQFPPLTIVQTSSKQMGQIYIPTINWVLMVGTIVLVLTFHRAQNLASAYGVAISTTMVITTLLTYAVSREQWGWPRLLSIPVTAGFLLVDLTFFGANIIKVKEGGWVPLLIAGLAYTLMSTWSHGRNLLEEELEEEEGAMEDFLQKIGDDPPVRVAGTAVFMTGRRQGPPPMLLHHLEHNQVLHESVLLVTVVIEDVPRIWPSERLEVKPLDHGLKRIVIYFGFMEDPDVPAALRLTEKFGLEIDLQTVTYYVGKRTLLPSDKKPGMVAWRERLFAFMSRNAASITAFYELPPERVIEFGIRVEI